MIEWEILDPVLGSNWKWVSTQHPKSLCSWGYIMMSPRSVSTPTMRFAVTHDLVISIEFGYPRLYTAPAGTPAIISLSLQDSEVKWDNGFFLFKTKMRYESGRPVGAFIEVGGSVGYQVVITDEDDEDDPADYSTETVRGSFTEAVLFLVEGYYRIAVKCPYSHTPLVPLNRDSNITITDTTPFDVSATAIFSDPRRLVAAHPELFMQVYRETTERGTMRAMQAQARVNRNAMETRLDNLLRNANIDALVQHLVDDRLQQLGITGNRRTQTPPRLPSEDGADSSDQD